MRVLRILSIVALIAVLAIVAGCERKVVNQVSNDNQQLTGCFACHGEESFGGAILEAQGEWQNSVHASGTNIDYTNRGGGNDCTRCHSQQGFIEFLNTGAVSAPYSTVSAIHCFTCHAPHETGTLKLRTEAPFALLNGSVFDHGAGNLCANCHHSRMSATLPTPTDSISSRYGSHHGPQGDLFEGANGYQYSNPTYPYESSSHRALFADGCIDCHMGNPQIHDGYKVGGHSFNMVDEATGTNLSAGCARASNCHPAATSYNFIAKADYDGNGVIDSVHTEFAGLVDTLQALLIQGGYLNATTLAPKSMRVPTDVAGAVYNYVMVNEDRSQGAHNFKYVVALLKNSIKYLKDHPAGSSALVAGRQD
jgi:hypothetical protein